MSGKTENEYYKEQATTKTKGYSNTYTHKRKGFQIICGAHNMYNIA